MFSTTCCIKWPRAPESNLTLQRCILYCGVTMEVGKMLEKRPCSRVFALVSSLVLSGGLAQAAVLFNATVSLANTDPTQLGRLGRDNITPDWSFDKDFPGVLNPTVSYHYKAFSVFVPSWFSFLQISIDNTSPDLLGSVYDTSYNPNPLAANRGLDVNYLGDPGISVDPFGNPLFFQVVDRTAANSSSGGRIVLVLNETTNT